jgi:hypothetical protein
MILGQSLCRFYILNEFAKSSFGDESEEWALAF